MSEIYEDNEDEEEDDYFWCPTCRGKGTVNPLTAPPDFFCVGTTDCPTCDGTGEI
jgi:DnaJ-class molecular chaperone